MTEQRRNRGGIRVTEADWLNDTISLYFKADFLQDQLGSQRRARLFACACCRRVWHLLQLEAARRIVELAEEYADGEATAEQLQSIDDPACFADLEDRTYGLAEPRLSILAYDAILAAKSLASPVFRPSDAGIVAEWTAKDPADDSFRSPESRGRPHGVPPDDKQRAELSRLQREIFGNPFRPVTFRPAWRTLSAVAVADQMYQSRDFAPMPILADALEEAGCDNEGILSHCREPGVHVRGCWVVDLVLGKD